MFKNKIYQLFWALKIINNNHFKEILDLTRKEKSKSPKRTEVINFLLSLNDNKKKYLEIGVRNPSDNFNHILAEKKYSVDPGVEFEENPVDFKMTSDLFFSELQEGKILEKNIKFDVIFIDGLHLAEQVDRDIKNSLLYLKEDGFLVLHDCNPPSEWHARENHKYYFTPALNYWNGTTWKAFLKWRFNKEVYSCCIDADWGIGIISKRINIGEQTKNTNSFFEYDNLNKDRVKLLNLITFEEFKKRLKSDPNF